MKPKVIRDPDGAIVTIVIYPLKKKDTANKLISEIENMAKKSEAGKKSGTNKPNED